MAPQTWKVGSFEDEKVVLEFSWDDATRRITDVSYKNETALAASLRVVVPGGVPVDFALKANSPLGALVSLGAGGPSVDANVQLDWPATRAAGRPDTPGNPGQ